jgi:hypothetical protein
MRTRAFLLAGVLAAVSAPLAAQGAEVGLKGGLSFGNISNKGLLPGDLKTRTGFAAGLYLGFGASVVSFGAEGLYAQRGLESDQSLADSETRLDYIDIPVYLKIRIPTPGVRPYIFAGPQVSLEIRCHTAGGGTCSELSERKSTDYAGVIGAGVRLGGSTAIGLEGRYVYGLSDLKLSTVTSGESYKHRTFMLLLSIGK